MTDYLKKHLHRLITGLTVCLVAVVGFAGLSKAQAYVNSAHGNSSTGVERFELGITPGKAGYAIGNCVHCHEEHGTMRGSEPPIVSGGPDIYLGFEVEEDLCYGCHSPGAGVEPAGRDVRDKIETDILKTYSHDPTSALYSHRANETSVDSISTDKHVECTDCHNPHEAKTENDGLVGPRTKGSNAIGANSPLRGVSGVEFSGYPNEWTTTLTTWNAIDPSNYTFTDPATMEYQICFKCHTSFSGNTDDWDGAAPSSSLAWTDVAMEFDPGNASRHPVVRDIVIDNLNALQLEGDPYKWNPGQTMYCSDCHGSDDDGMTNDRYGPHGSSIRWMLTGTYKNWPYESSSDNGCDETCGTAVFASLSDTTTATTFCRNCHPNPLDESTSDATPNQQSTNAHWTSGVGTSQHVTNSVVCVACHIRVPHGGKIGRLISTDSSGLPDRYRPSGTSGGMNPSILVFRKQTTVTGYGEADCKGPMSFGHNITGIVVDKW